MKLLMSGIWLISLVVAYLLGSAQVDILLPARQYTHPTTPVADTESEHAVNPVQSEFDATNKAFNARRTDAAMSPSIEEISVEDVVMRTNTLLLNRGIAPSMASIAKAYILVSKLDLNQTKAALNLIEPGDDPTKMQILQLYINRLAELSPTQALDYVNYNLDDGLHKEAALASVITAWGEADPRAAIQWYTSQSGEAAEQGMAKFMLIGLYSSLARKDLDEAIDSLETSFAGDDFASLELAVRGTAASLESSADFDVLLQRVQTMQNEPAMHALFASWMSKNPEQALLRLDELRDEALVAKIEENAFRTWLMMSPDDAAEKLMQRATPEEKQSSAQFIVDGLSIRNPEKALDWLKRQVDIEAEPLISNILTRATFRNPQFAEQNLHLVTNKQESVQLATQIFRGYQRYSEAKANEFLSRQQSDVRQQVIGNVEKMDALRKSR